MKTLPLLLLSLLLALAAAGRDYPASVVSVYDGDTLTVLVDLGLGVQLRDQVRVLGVDAPELHGSSRAAGLAARDYLNALVKDRRLVLRVDDASPREKYGRLLAAVFLVEPDGTLRPVAALLLAAGHAKAYDGGRRAGP